jgi:hypothetical protein
MLAREGTKVTGMHFSTNRGVPCMTSPEQYRRFAQECLELARWAKDVRTRAMLSQMAAVWFRLAKELEEKAGRDAGE